MRVVDGLVKIVKNTFSREMEFEGIVIEVRRRNIRFNNKPYTHYQIRKDDGKTELVGSWGHFDRPEVGDRVKVVVDKYDYLLRDYCTILELSVLDKAP